MKTKNFILLATALLFAAACQDDIKLEVAPDDNQEEQKDDGSDIPEVKEFVLFATASEAPVPTKTELDSENYIVWKSGDALSVWGDGKTNVKLTLDSDSAGERTGAFSGEFTPSGSDFDLTAIYPYSESYGTDATAVTVTIPATVDQKTSVNEIIGKTDFMFGKASFTGTPEKYAMSFTHPLALIDIKVDASTSCLRTATLSTVTIESNGDAIVGDFTADPANGTLTEGSASGKLLTVNFPATASASSVQHAWVAIRPVDLTEAGCTIVLTMTNGQKLTFNVKPQAAFEAETIYTFNLDDLDTRVDKRQANPTYFDLVAAHSGPGSNRANCYIVREGGYYKFAAQRVDKTNVFGSSTSGYTADWLWATGTESKVDAVGLGGSGAVNFRVQAEANGNTIIAVSDADKNIVWSWHIWCSVEDPMTPTTWSRGNSWNVSARNLGALSTTDGDSNTNLLYYQYGRKDPFPASTDNVVFNTSSTAFKSTDLTMTSVNNSGVPTDAVAFAVANPTKFINSTGNNTWVKGKTMDEVQTLWSNSSSLAKDKTIYDPCPAGYSMIINIDQAWYTYFVAKTASTEYGVTFNTKGITYTDPDGYSTYYPAAGYLNTLNDLKESGTNVRVWSATLKGSDTNIQGRMLYVTVASGTITNNTARTYFALPARCLKMN